MKVIVTYQGQIKLETNAPDEDTAEEVVLDEIDTWSEAEFIERLELEIANIEFIKLESPPRAWWRNVLAGFRI